MLKRYFDAKEIACVSDRAGRASGSLLCGVETYYAKVD